MERLNNVHPGEVLYEDFLKPMGIKPYRLAKDINFNQTGISEIIKGKRGISPLIAIKLAKFFNTSVKFWLGLQNDYDIEEEMLKRKNELDKIVAYVAHSH